MRSSERRLSVLAFSASVPYVLPLVFDLTEETPPAQLVVDVRRLQERRRDADHDLATDDAMLDRVALAGDRGRQTLGQRRPHGVGDGRVLVRPGSNQLCDGAVAGLALQTQKGVLRH